MKGFPKGEVLWETYTTEKGEVYFITSKEFDRSFYYLYRQEQNNKVRVGKAKTPVELEKKFIKN